MEVARRLGLLGFGVQTNPDLKDDGVDIRALDPNGRSLTLGVKSRNIRWTSRDDYPFPDIHVVQLKDFLSSLDAYICVSQETQAILVVQQVVYPRGFTKAVRDPQRGWENMLTWKREDLRDGEDWFDSLA